MIGDRLPPLSDKDLAQLHYDRLNITATAERKSVTLTKGEAVEEENAAQHHFELGCWLFYYRNKIYVDNHEGFSARVDCLWRIFTAGFNRIEYEFFTVFEFGERHFDTIFEMGDEKAVLDQIRKRYQTNPNTNVVKVFASMGWTLT